MWVSLFAKCGRMPGAVANPQPFFPAANTIPENSSQNNCSRAVTTAIHVREYLLTIDVVEFEQRLDHVEE
jgi:hypothetical protein